MAKIKRTASQCNGLIGRQIAGLTVFGLWIVVEIFPPFNGIPLAGKMVTEVAT